MPYRSETDVRNRILKLISSGVVLCVITPKLIIFLAQHILKGFTHFVPEQFSNYYNE